MEESYMVCKNCLNWDILDKVSRKGCKVMDNVTNKNHHCDSIHFDGVPEGEDRELYKMFCYAVDKED